MSADRPQPNSCEPQLPAAGQQSFREDSGFEASCEASAEASGAPSGEVPGAPSGAALHDADAGDLPGIIRLLQAESLPIQGVDESLLAGTVVARFGNKIIGSASVERHGRVGLLRSVVVAPGFRDRDLGRALVRNRIGWARASGLSALALFTETARGFFERLDFSCVPRAELPVEVCDSFEFGFCPTTSESMLLALEADPRARIDDRYTRAAGESCGSHLGCGNPAAVARLSQGDVVLDLGSGGGLEAIESARRVGLDGIAYGVDANDAMLVLANENRARAGVENVRFLKGRIEELPLPNDHVDIIISNCVLNLSLDKPRAFREAFRVLRAGGRLAISDIVTKGPAPEDIKTSAEEALGCLAGTASVAELETILAEIGFTEIKIEEVRTYEHADFQNLTRDDAHACAGILMSAVIRATKLPRTGDQS